MVTPRLARADGLSFRAVGHIPGPGQRGLFHVKHPLPVALDTADLQAPWRQSAVGIVGPQPQTVFRPRCEHPVGLGDPQADEVVDQDAEIALGPIDDERLGQRRVQPGDKALGSRLFVSRRAIDLPSHVQTGDLARFQGSFELPRVDVVVFDGVPWPAHDGMLQPGDGLQHLVLYFTRQ